MDNRYLNVIPSDKALARAREKIRDMTGPQRCCVPIPELIKEINRWTMSWSRYYRHGYPRSVFRKLNWFVGKRLGRHLRRRSQRPFRTVEGRDSLCQVATPRPAALVTSSTDSPAHALERDSSVKPDTGRSSRQDCNLAGVSPAVTIAQIGHVAMPQPGSGNRPGDAWCKRPGRPASLDAVAGTT